MQPIVQIHDVSKVYLIKERLGLFHTRKRMIHALRNVTLEVAPGELFGLLGPNGAGKTTLIKCLTTLLLPTSGTIRVNGYDALRQDVQVRASIGCMLVGERGLYWKLTGRENLNYFAALYGVPPTLRTQRVTYLLEQFRLTSYADRLVESYSSGQKKKLLAAKALINDAPLLIFDEPTSTLDIHSAYELRDRVRELHNQGRTIVYTTHVLAEAEELCQRIAIIDDGQIIALGTLAELRSQANQPEYLCVSGYIPECAVTQLQEQSFVSTIDRTVTDGQTTLVIYTPHSHHALPHILAMLYESGARVDSVEKRSASLEDIFFALTGKHV